MPKYHAIDYLAEAQMQIQATLNCFMLVPPAHGDSQSYYPLGIIADNSFRHPWRHAKSLPNVLQCEETHIIESLLDIVQTPLIDVEEYLEYQSNDPDRGSQSSVEIIPSSNPESPTLSTQQCQDLKRTLKKQSKKSSHDGLCKRNAALSPDLHDKDAQQATCMYLECPEVTHTSGITELPSTQDLCRRLKSKSVSDPFLDADDNPVSEIKLPWKDRKLSNSLSVVLDQKSTRAESFDRITSEKTATMDLTEEPISLDAAHEEDRNFAPMKLQREDLVKSLILSLGKTTAHKDDLEMIRPQTPGHEDRMLIKMEEKSGPLCGILESPMSCDLDTSSVILPAPFDDPERVEKFSPDGNEIKECLNKEVMTKWRKKIETEEKIFTAFNYMMMKVPDCDFPASLLSVSLREVLQKLDVHPLDMACADDEEKFPWKLDKTPGCTLNKTSEQFEGRFSKQEHDVRNSSFGKIPVAWDMGEENLLKQSIYPEQKKPSPIKQVLISTRQESTNKSSRKSMPPASSAEGPNYKKMSDVKQAALSTEAISLDLPSKSQNNLTKSKEDLTPSKECPISRTSSKDGPMSSKEGPTLSKESLTLSEEGTTLSEEGTTSSKEDLTTSKEDLTTSKEDLIPNKEGLSSSKEDPTSIKEGLTQIKEGLTPSDKGLTLNNKNKCVQTGTRTDSQRSTNLPVGAKTNSERRNYFITYSLQKTQILEKKNLQAKYQKNDLFPEYKRKQSVGVNGSTNVRRESQTRERSQEAGKGAEMKTHEQATASVSEEIGAGANKSKSTETNQDSAESSDLHGNPKCRALEQRKLKSRIVEVQIPDFYKDALAVIERTCMPSIRYLQKCGELAFHVTFHSLGSDFTRFLIKQEEQKELDRDSKRDALRHLMMVHIGVVTYEIALHCDLTSAIMHLAAQCEKHKLLIQETLAEIRKGLCMKHCEMNTKRLLHPKLGELAREIKLWYHRKLAKEGNDQDPKILIIVKTVSSKLLEACTSATNTIQGIKSVQLTSPSLVTPATISKALDRHNCIVATTSQIGPDFLWAQFSLVVEYEYSEDASAWKDLCLRQNVRHLGLMVKAEKKQDKTALEQVCQEKQEGSQEEGLKLLCSTKVTSNSSLLHLLEARYNYTLIERDYLALLHSGDKRASAADIMVDDRTGILLLSETELETENCVEPLVYRVTYLSLQYSKLWIVGSLDRRVERLSGRLVQNLSKLHAAVAQFSVKEDDFELKVLFADSVERVAELIKLICDETRKRASRAWLEDDWLKRTWLTMQPSKHEVFLLQFPCVNSFTAQILLTAATLPKLLSASLHQLTKIAPWLSQKVIQMFWELAHRSAHVASDRMNDIAASKSLKKSILVIDEANLVNTDVKLRERAARNVTPSHHLVSNPKQSSSKLDASWDENSDMDSDSSHSSFKVHQKPNLYSIPVTEKSALELFEEKVIEVGGAYATPLKEQVTHFPGYHHSTSGASSKVFPHPRTQTGQEEYYFQCNPFISPPDFQVELPSRSKSLSSSYTNRQISNDRNASESLPRQNTSQISQHVPSSGHAKGITSNYSILSLEEQERLLPRGYNRYRQYPQGIQGNESPGGSFHGGEAREAIPYGRFPSNSTRNSQGRIQIGIAQPCQRNSDGGIRRISQPTTIEPQPSVRSLFTEFGERRPFGRNETQPLVFSREQCTDFLDTDEPKRRRLTFEKVPGSKGGQTRLTFI